eukprot:3690676-Prymnesium_polylepis.1
MALPFLIYVSACKHSTCPSTIRPLLDPNQSDTSSVALHSGHTLSALRELGIGWSVPMGRCVSTCPDGRYVEKGGSKCIDCSKGCRRCKVPPPRPRATAPWFCTCSLRPSGGIFAPAAGCLCCARLAAGCILLRPIGRRL